MFLQLHNPKVIACAHGNLNTLNPFIVLFSMLMGEARETIIVHHVGKTALQVESCFSSFILSLVLNPHTFKDSNNFLFVNIYIIKCSSNLCVLC